MDQDGTFHIRYLESRILKLKKRPDLNSLQIPAYEEILKIAKLATSYDDYLLRLGEDNDLFSFAKAEHLDRNQSMATLYQKMGLSENEVVFQKRIAVVNASKSYVDLATKIPQTIALPEEKDAVERLNSAMTFLHLLFQINTLPKKTEKEYKAKQAKAEFELVKKIDQSFGFDSFFTLPYVLINPFTKLQLKRLEVNFNKILAGGN